MQYLPWLISACFALVAAWLAFSLLKNQNKIKKLENAINSAFSLGNLSDIEQCLEDEQTKKIAITVIARLRETEQLKLDYEKAEQELKDTVVNISHDLRTPLTAINGYFALLEREEKSENAERYISQIKNRVAAITVLTEELFRHSVVNSVRASSMMRVDLCEALEESLISYYGAFEGRGIVPTISIPSQPVWRECDRSALARVFGNIIGNAVKYSDGDFCVVLTEHGEITFENSASALENADVSRHFERFYTVDTENGSTGLGLAIAKSLVERMHGDIYAEYNSGRLKIHIRFGE